MYYYLQLDEETQRSDQRLIDGKWEPISPSDVGLKIGDDSGISADTVRREMGRGLAAQKLVATGVLTLANKYIDAMEELEEVKTKSTEKDLKILKLMQCFRGKVFACVLEGGGLQPEIKKFIESRGGVVHFIKEISSVGMADTPLDMEMSVIHEIMFAAYMKVWGDIYA